MNIQTTLFDTYGGMPHVARIVLAWYDKVLISAALAPYFTGLDMRTLIDHQSQFVASLMGGPPSFTNDELRHAHQHLGIDDGAFDAMVQLFAETLSDHQVHDDHIASLLAAINAYRPLIVTA